MYRQQTNQKNQTGLVSIMVVGIIAVLITLVVLAFSRISNRDLRQSLDRQLSAQAGYAAETGLNDAVAMLKAGTLADQSNCSNGVNAVYGSVANASVGSTGASVTCVLVKSSTDKLRVDNQPVGSTKVLVVNNAFEVNSLLFSWDGGSVSYPYSGTSNSNATSPSLPTISEWPGLNATSTATIGNKPAVLKVSIIPIVDDSTQVPANQWNTAAAIQAHTQTYFLYPNGDNAASVETGKVNYNNAFAGYPNENGAIVLGDCNKNTAGSAVGSGGTYTYACNSFIKGLPGGNNSSTNPGGSQPPFAAPFKADNGSTIVPASAYGIRPPNGYFATAPNSTYYIVVRPIYNDASYTISASRVGGTDYSLGIYGSQSTVDITAKAGDIVKRTQARVNLSSPQVFGDSFNPGYGIESADTLCKLILVPTDTSGATTGDADTACGF